VEPCTSTAAAHKACRGFRINGEFTSGIGVHYSPSPITSTAHQAIASNLIIGMRLPPHLVICAADARPIEIQDLCPADTRFKIIVFTGPSHGAHLNAVTAELERANGWMRRYGGDATFDIITVCQGSKDTVEWLGVPKVLRSNWRKYAFLSLIFQAVAVC